MMLVTLMLQLLASFLVSCAIAKPFTSTTTFITNTTAIDLTDLYDDCETALATLPTDPPGQPLPTKFSRNPDLGIYSLDKTVTEGDCRIRVFFAPDASQEQSSWTEIRAKLQEMITECREQRCRHLMRTAGRYGYIQLQFWRVNIGL